MKIWLSEQRSRLKNSSYNEYLRFLRHLFQIGVDHKVMAESPVAGLKQFRVEKPIRSTPTWDQFLEIAAEIRNQKFTKAAQDSADLVEFRGRAGVGTAECANLLGDPNYILSVIKDRDRRIGACADTGHWARSNLDPVECLRILKGRIVSSHLKDLNEKGIVAAHDVPCGTGVSDIPAILEELKA